MIQYNVFPGGKTRIVTFSYDDGDPRDGRLVELFDLYGVKGTFHLNSARFKNMDSYSLEDVRERYRGHEISCHTVNHGWTGLMSPQSVVNEIMEDRRFLEKLAGEPVIGLSYPNGSFNEPAIGALNACGIVYARTARSTGSFALPDNFMVWNPTCHHRDGLALAEKFVNDLDNPWTGQLFYMWGHSHELRTEEDWEKIEKIIDLLSNHEQIWYATNLEIWRYMTAQRALEISADETIFRNPTATDVCVRRGHQEIVTVPAGQTVTV